MTPRRLPILAALGIICASIVLAHRGDRPARVAVAQDEPVAPKADKEPVLTAPKVIRTIPITRSSAMRPDIATPAPLPAPPTIAAVEPVEPERAPHRVGDICERHGGHRQDYVTGNRPMWRCVFPKR